MNPRIMQLITRPQVKGGHELDERRAAAQEHFQKLPEDVRTKLRIAIMQSNQLYRRICDGEWEQALRTLASFPQDEYGTVMVELDRLTPNILAC